MSDSGSKVNGLEQPILFLEPGVSIVQNKKYEVIRMAKLHLVRHSEPAWGTELPPSKWVLTGQGKIRSRELGVYLGKQGVSRIFSSDENKAVETAEITSFRTHKISVLRILTWTKRRKRVRSFR